jgi:hypothetical protein
MNSKQRAAFSRWASTLIGNVETPEPAARALGLVTTDSAFLSVGFSQARYPKGNLT